MHASSRACFATAALVFLYTLMATLPCAAQGQDWPGFLGAKQTGKSSEAGFDWDWKKAPPKLLWSQESPGGYGIGSVANGKYFHFDRMGDVERLLCLSAADGELLWKFEYETAYEDMYGFDNGPRCSPVVDEDRVYIFGAEGKLHCLSVASGEVLWKVDTAAEFKVVQYFFGVGSTPSVYGDLLITMIGGSPATEDAEGRKIRIDAAEPNGSAIVAFDKKTGEVRYKTIDDLASYATPIVVDVAGKPTGLAFCRERLHGFDPANGQAKWSFPWRARKYESVNASTPVMSGDQVLITESYGPGGALLNIAGAEPKIVWQDGNVRDQRLACHWCTPIIVDGFAYASHGEKVNESELRCVELATGKVRWSEPGLGRLNLLYADGQLICMAEFGSLIVVQANPEKFSLTAKYAAPDGRKFSAPCYAAPILAHGRLYFRDARRVYCLELPRR
ncbi:MAG: PQQ-binding-like beta-propeller repeat protein [Pirellulaceae bacterium]